MIRYYFSFFFPMGYYFLFWSNYTEVGSRENPAPTMWECVASPMLPRSSPVTVTALVRSLPHAAPSPVRAAASAPGRGGGGTGTLLHLTLRHSRPVRECAPGCSSDTLKGPMQNHILYSVVGSFSLSLEHFLSLSLTFRDLHTLKNCRPISRIGACLMFSHDQCQLTHPRQECHWRDSVSLSLPVLIIWWRWCLPGFPTVKLLLSFVIKEHFVGEGVLWKYVNILFFVTLIYSLINLICGPMVFYFNQWGCYCHLFLSLVWSLGAPSTWMLLEKVFLVPVL